MTNILVLVEYEYLSTTDPPGHRSLLIMSKTMRHSIHADGLGGFLHISARH